MRKFTLVLLFSFAGFWCLAQDAPASPDQQSPAPPNGQMEHRHHPGVMGTITAINDGSLTVKTMNGETAQVNLSDKTQYRKDRQTAKLSDFKVGDQVFVRGESTAQNTWQADVVASGRPGGGMREGMGKQFIAGEIKAINGTQLTVLRPDGVTQSINVDESTSFRKQGQSVTLADIQVGDHVFGRGEMKNNVFVPSTLNVGEMGMGRGGWGQGRGQGQGQGAGQGANQAPPDPQ